MVDVNARGRTIKRGLKLWRICVDTAKDLLHGRLDKVKAHGPGYVHLNRYLSPEWFGQLTAEHRIRVRTARGWEERWVCPAGHRNEALDCTVIVMFLCQVLGLHTQTAATWERWESALLPDLFSAPVPQPLPALPATSAPVLSDEPIQRTVPPVLPPPVPRQPVRPSSIASSAWSSRL